MNTQPNDGGSAFPMPGFTDDPGNPGRTYWPENGMTLRDWFAGQALAGYCADGQIGEDAVKWSWEVADAMLAARAATNQPPATDH